MPQEEIRKLFKNYRFLFFREYGLYRDKLENFTANKVIHRLKQKKAEAVTVRGARAGGLVIGWANSFGCWFG